MISYTQPQSWRGVAAVSADAVIAAIAMPRGGVMHGFNGQLKLWQGELAVDLEVAYGLAMYAVPILDPDAAATYDAIWDAQVPKNKIQAEGVMDLDTGAADVTPEYEPGEVNWEGVFDMERGPRRLYRRRKTITSVSAGPGPGSSAAFATHYVPKDSVNISVKGGFRARVPTAVMLGLSNPTLDRTTGTVLTSPTEDEWFMLRYLEDTAIDAMKFLVGRVEAGAKTPYQEAAVFLDKTLAPDPFEYSGALRSSVEWNASLSCQFTMSVPGKMKARLDGDR